jgi:hypothetical protein
MNCCAPTILPFTNSGGIVIPYTVSLKAKYGNLPSVVVYHIDNGEYVVANVSATVDGNPATEIRIDNGGAATGFVKIFR